MKSKRLILSLMIYLLGTISLLCSDFYISKNFNEINIANWATLKSVMFVFGGICIFGFDQILVRYPEIFKRILNKYILQILILSTVLGFCLSNIFLYDFEYICISLIIFQYALTQFFASAFRGNAQLVEAQIFTNGWKIFTFLFLFLGVVNLAYVYIYSFLSVIFLGLYWVYNYNLEIQDEKILENNYKLGFFFLLNSLSLTMATYGEQILINIFGNKNISYHVFNYVLAFNSFILVFVGFLGFYFVPKLKKIQFFSEILYKKYILSFMVVGLLLCVLGFFVGILVFKYYLQQPLNYTMAILCLFSAYIKVVYIIPSVGVSLYCSQSQVKNISVFNICNLFLYVLMFYIAMNFSGDYMIHAIFLVMSIHWLLRLLNTHKFVVQALREKNV